MFPLRIHKSSFQLRKQKIFFKQKFFWYNSSFKFLLQVQVQVFVFINSGHIKILKKYITGPYPQRCIALVFFELSTLLTIRFGVFFGSIVRIFFGSVLNRSQIKQSMHNMSTHKRKNVCKVLCTRILRCWFLIQIHILQPHQYFYAPKYADSFIGKVQNGCLIPKQISN